MPRACLLVAQTFPPLIGGSAGVYAALAEAASGEIAVLSATHDHATGREHAGWRAVDAALPYPVRRVRFARPPLAEAAPRGRLARNLHWAPHAARLAAAVARAARDVTAVCVCDDDAVGWLVPFARRVLRRRALIYCHGDDLVETDPAAIARRRRFFAEADAVVAAGDFAAARLTGAYGVPAEKIATIRNGVDLARFAPRPEPAGLRAALGAEGRRVLLAPTRLVPRKGVDRLIDALPAILAAEPRAFLVVAGDGPQRAASGASVNRRITAAAIAAQSSLSTSRPLRPSSTASAVPPARPPTTGRPAALASRKTSGSPSLSPGSARLGSTTHSASA
jgi:phosphatidyl-myo-inositol dimannoside synthase